MLLTPAGVFCDEYICMLLIFMFPVHYCCRFYTNDAQWNNKTALPQNSNDVFPGEKCKDQPLQHTNITQTRRIQKRTELLAPAVHICQFKYFPH